jgi:predicted house-cleaning noncanonical NTP pyrophosphatase (MazG superfamily)
MKKTYNKLVRDRIPEIIERDGKNFSVSQVRGKSLKSYAMKKLEEEIQEFIENPCAEEAADVMEIMNFICHRLGIYNQTIVAEATAKHVRRGGFDSGFILEWVED